MDERMPISEWSKKFTNGDFTKPDFDTQVAAGWYDWFCKETSLAGKTKKLGNKLLQIMDSPKFNKDKCYVWFKNNCPMVGNLYDDFRIADIETCEVIYTIVPSSGFTKNKGKAELWGKENDFQGPIVEGTWKDIKNYFLK